MNVKKTILWFLISCVLLGSQFLKASVNTNPSLVYYVVTEGDTLPIISKRYGITVDELKSINNEVVDGEVGVGQVIYVPAKPVVSEDKLPALGVNENSDGVRNFFGNSEKFVAEQAKRIGQTYGAQVGHSELKIDSYTRFSNSQRNQSSPNFFDNESKYIKKYAESSLESAIDGAVNRHFLEGKAKFNFGFDDAFNIQRFSADVLTPLRDDYERMLFLQGGGRYDKSNERTIFNLGIGQRHFTEEVMFGYNSFWDYDVNRHHSRLGLGGEVWADFVKLSMNFYTPISDWKNSIDFNEYFERAARGFDFNAKYYLPKYPQVGFSAKIEQYFGDEVDLLGNKKIERNPYSGAFGVEWRPVPMFKFGMNHREAKGGQSDTQFDLGLEWVLGASLNEMLDPQKVTESRSLQGMRHDLVERNNNIVLQYKKNKRIVSIEHEPIRGLSGETVKLNPLVSISTGNVMSWRWAASDPLLQGALSNANVQSPSLTLPVLPADVMIDREFSLFLTIIDDLGDSYQSPPIPVVVQVNPELLMQRVIVMQNNLHIADSYTGQVANILVKDKHIDLDFVLVRQLKDDDTSYVTEVEEAKDVVFSELVGFQVEMLKGELRPRSDSRVGSREHMWVNKFRITPIDPVPGMQQQEVLNFYVNGEVGKSGMVGINLLRNDIPELTNPPHIKELRLVGRLELGHELRASYTFDDNGGERSDHSIYAWGHKGETQAAVVNGSTVTQSGQIPAISLGIDDVGNVMELSVQSKNGLGIKGNILTVDSTMSLEEGNGLENGPTVVDPTTYHVELRYNSSATLEENGVKGIRPVVQLDEMTAYCKIHGEQTTQPCDEERYAFRWLVRDKVGSDMPIRDAISRSYMPRSADQGKRILVEVTIKEKH